MLAFFKSRQNNGTTLFASIEHSKAIKGPEDFKFKFLKGMRMVLLNPLELFFCQVLG
jgi:hypothetical protein